MNTTAPPPARWCRASTMTRSPRVAGPAYPSRTRTFPVGKAGGPSVKIVDAAAMRGQTGSEAADVQKPVKHRNAGNSF